MQKFYAIFTNYKAEVFFWGILLIYFFLRIYEGHDYYLMQIHTYAKNFDVVAGTLIAARMAFHYALKQKKLDKIELTKSAMLICALILYSQQAKLKTIKSHIEDFNPKNNEFGSTIFMHKWLVPELSLHINQEIINRIVSHDLLAKHPEAIENLQGMLVSSDIYKQCYGLISIINALIDKLLYGAAENKTNLQKELLKTLKTITELHEYCSKLNTSAIKDLISMANHLFPGFKIPLVKELVLLL